ncbi:mitochondrial inner membrane protein-domain-containing protein [Limtongia smithiae]|uniref:mitochondrial inner membrane protein-domain-containing protein n=1 Tax=Limtongia smithiae TaxID=1125753 RepID=UPI0034CEC1BF
MLRITARSLRSGQFRALQPTSRLFSYSIVRRDVKNTPPSSVPKEPAAPGSPIENPTPVTPSTPTVAPAEVAAQATAAIPPPPPPKKKRRFRNFLLTLMVLGTALYGGGAYASLNNDNFHDFFTEFVPFGEELVMLIEEREFQRRFPNAGRKPLEEDSSSRVTVQRGGATWKLMGDEYKGPSSGPHMSAVAKVEPVKETVVVPAPAPLPAAMTGGAVSTTLPEPLVIKEAVMPKLPKFVFDGTIDPALEGVVKAINTLFTALSKTGTAGPEELAGLAASLGEVSGRFVTVKEKYEADLQQALLTQVSVLAAQAETAALETQKQVSAVDEKWKEGFFAERQRILATYKKRLANELKKFTAIYTTKIKNEVMAANAEKDIEISKQVVEKVEAERAARLSQMAEIKAAFEDIVSLSHEADKLLEVSERTADLQLALGSLTNALMSPYPVPLGPIIQRIKAASEGDELILKALSAVPQSSYAGVLSHAQLAAQFKLIAPEIRKVSLAPVDAGVAGFAGSWLLSKLLWKKEGKPVGTDVESVLARAESALLEGQVEEAVREVNTLNGWRKKLAEDWLAEGRRRSEVEFLAQVLSEEGKIWQYKL